MAQITDAKLESSKDLINQTLNGSRGTANVTQKPAPAVFSACKGKKDNEQFFALMSYLFTDHRVSARMINQLQRQICTRYRRS